MTSRILVGKRNIHLKEVEGLPVPPVPRLTSWGKQVNLIRELELRKDDVILCAYPKAGTHWLWEVISMLLAGQAVHEPRAKELLMMDVTPVSKLDKLHSPRVLNTHLPFSMLPTSSMRARRVKIVHVYRNPRDVMMSMYYHFRQFKLEHTETVQQYCKAFLAGKVVYGHYARYLNQMNSFMKDNSDLPVFNVSFEEMKQDTQGCVRRLAEYLGVSASETLIWEIVQACSFRSMKKVDATKEKVRFMGLELEQKLYRKGEVGDWRNHLSEEEVETFDREFSTVLDNEHFPFLYNPDWRRCCAVLSFDSQQSVLMKRV